MKKILEICCESVTSAKLAEEAGADRIELCANLAQGGTTPSAGQLKQAKSLLSIPVFVLIRPRKADFLYSALEFQQMLLDIEIARKLGADGIVSGILRKDGTIDTKRTQLLVEASAPLPFTFHRAFDMCKDPFQAIDQLTELGVARVLTSGQQPTALEGLPNLRTFADHAGDQLTILACGELLPDNLTPILSIPNIHEFHTAARKTVFSQMHHRGNTNMGDEAVADEFRWQETDPESVRKMRNILNGNP